MLVNDKFTDIGGQDCPSLPSGKTAAATITSAGQGAVPIHLQDVAMIVHELRNPLMALIGYGQMLAKLGDAAARGQIAQQQEQIGNHMLAIVNDLLDMAKSGAGGGGLQLRRVPVNTLRLMMDSVAVVESMAQGKGVTLKLDLDYGFPLEFIGDPQRLRQILINLLSNATKFSESGTVTLRARVELMGPCLSFSVEDHGVGMSEDELQRLFHPFHQMMHDCPKQTGTGLGLVISRNLAVAMGGSLSAHSIKGQGSTFTFALPFCNRRADHSAVHPRDPVQTLVADSMMRRFRQGGVTLPSQNCLVVDDNETLRDLIGSLLRSGGHCVDVAASGAEALQQVIQKPYDLVLLDRYMPGLDGFATARRLRAIYPAGTGPLLVGLSGIVDAEDEDLAQDSGMDALFSKASNPIDLIDGITRMVAASRRKA